MKERRAACRVVVREPMTDGGGGGGGGGGDGGREGPQRRAINHIFIGLLCGEFPITKVSQDLSKVRRRLCESHSRRYVNGKRLRVSLDMSFIFRRNEFF